MIYFPLVYRKYRNGPTWKQDGRTNFRTPHSKHSIIKQNKEAFHFVQLSCSDIFILHETKELQDVAWQ